MAEPPGKLPFDPKVPGCGALFGLNNLLQQRHLGCLGQQLVIKVENTPHSRIRIFGQFKKA